MSDDEAENIYPDAQPPPAERAEAQSPTGDETYLYTTRSVDQSVENLLTQYVQWCRQMMRGVAISQDAEEPPEDFVKAIIPRAVRHVRRIARNEGSDAAIDIMSTDGTSPLHWAMYRVRTKWEEGKEAASNSEDDDKMDEELEQSIAFMPHRRGRRERGGGDALMDDLGG